MTASFSHCHARWGVLAAATLLGACANLQPASAPVDSPTTRSAPAGMNNAPTPAAAASAPRPAAAPAVAPGQPQAFATVVKDAKKIDGLFTLWQKDDKVWIELKPQDFGTAFFLAPKIARGIGEPGLYGGTLLGNWGAFGRQQVVEFKRVHNQVQLRARNTGYVAPAGTPAGRAVEAAFSESLLASTSVASQPHPESKSILVEANPLFMGDMLGLGMSLQRAYRQNYGFDARHSSFSAVRGRADAVFFEVSAHYAAPGLALSAPPGTPPGLAPSLPRSVPDARSLFLGLHYAIAKLPEAPMAPRPADPRVGYFTTSHADFGEDLARSPRRHHVYRWRLEKKDPAAALSEPVKPITFWLDRTIPLKYRDAITRGVLEWNKAFERIGFKDAVVAKVQPDDADFDTLDVGVASIRWMTNSRPTFGAIGPSHVDPRTGEILDADIGMESLSSRSIRSTRAQVLTARASVDWAGLMQLSSEERLADLMARRAAGEAACQHADMLAEQMSYAMDVLEARGEIDPGSPEAEQWVQDYLTDTTMHEVGHTLGLRHNFRSSRIYSDRQLSDADFVRANGLAGSVMEYAPINLARPGDRSTFAFQTTLGPYDYWAIEYAYKPMAPGTTPEQEAAELRRIAARSAEPALAYGTDEDSSLGVDPETLMFDLGDDPLAFAKKRVEIARDLLRRQESRELAADRDYAVLRRSVGYAVRDAARALGIAARQVGGIRTLRDFPGSGRDPIQPVPGDTQRAALDLLASSVLAPDAFVISPALQRRLAPDYMERTDAIFAGESGVGTEYSLSGAVLEMQRATLGHLMSDAVAQRLLQAQNMSAPEARPLRLSELFGRLTREVWSELDQRGDIPALRRDLQREHVNRLASAVVRPSAYSSADARSLVLADARSLLVRIEAASSRKGLSPEARAHLQDSVQTLRQALAATMQRAGV